MNASQPLLLNIAATHPATQVLGPGWRAVAWVQGCPIHCAGCIAPDWIPFKPARLVTPADLAEELLADPRVSGLTFSGGEPMAQAAGLAEVARLARQKREINIICFSGYTLEVLQKARQHSGVSSLLACVDVLIDGPFIAAKNDNRGLRGSSNQRIHYLTDRLKGVDLDQSPRRAEVLVRGDEVMMVGVPPAALLETLGHPNTRK